MLKIDAVQKKLQNIVRKMNTALFNREFTIWNHYFDIKYCRYDKIMVVESLRLTSSKSNLSFLTVCFWVHTYMLLVKKQCYRTRKKILYPFESPSSLPPWWCSPHAFYGNACVRGEGRGRKRNIFRLKIFFSPRLINATESVIITPLPRARLRRENQGGKKTSSRKTWRFNLINAPSPRATATAWSGYKTSGRRSLRGAVGDDRPDRGRQKGLKLSKSLLM